MKYNHKEIEPKWQKIWEEKGCFHAEENSDKEKFFALIQRKRAQLVSLNLIL